MSLWDAWVAPSVHVADSVKKSYTLLDVTMFISPDAVCCGGIICRAVMVGWVSPSVCTADAMVIELCLFMCIVYFVIGVCHHERRSAVNLMKTYTVESCRHRTAHVGE